MLEYKDLNDDERRTLREALQIERVHQYFLEDNNILLMEIDELFEYINIYGFKKLKDAVEFIKSIVKLEVKSEEVNKTIQQILIERDSKVIKLSDYHYAYKENG